MRGLLMLMSLGMVWQSHLLLQVWSSEPALWTHAIAFAPDKPRTLLNAGVAFSMAGNNTAACIVLTKAARDRRVVVPEWDALVHQAAMMDVASLRAAKACP